MGYFYASDGLLKSTWLKRLQIMFNFLTEIFDQVGMCKNMGYVVSIYCQPCRTIGGNSAKYYGLHIKVEGVTHWEILIQRVRCPECDEYLLAGSLMTHH